MKIKFVLLAGAMLAAATFALSAGAGSVTDTDVDGAPDPFDNCRLTSNGPLSPPPAKNQTDTDGDGIGDSCDCDFLNDGDVLGDDISDLFANFNTTSSLHDNTGDGSVLGDDVSNCFARFNTPAGDP